MTTMAIRRRTLYEDVADHLDKLIQACQLAQVEAGCRRFDVIEPDGGADAILLYDICRDRTDFDAHARSEHYARLDPASAGLVVSKAVRFGSLVCKGSA
jgi:quinol monooxygenase YgiN